MFPVARMRQRDPSGDFVRVHAGDFDRYVELNSCFGALTRTVAVDSSDRAEM